MQVTRTAAGGKALALQPSGSAERSRAATDSPAAASSRPARAKLVAFMPRQLADTSCADIRRIYASQPEPKPQKTGSGELRGAACSEGGGRIQCCGFPTQRDRLQRSKEEAVTIQRTLAAKSACCGCAAAQRHCTGKAIPLPDMPNYRLTAELLSETAHPLTMLRGRSLGRFQDTLARWH